MNANDRKQGTEIPDRKERVMENLCLKVGKSNYMFNSTLEQLLTETDLHLSP